MSMFDHIAYCLKHSGGGFVASVLLVLLTWAPAHARQCQITCPPGGISEPETCGATLNDGCSMATPTFTQIFCNATICGTAWADAGARDTDWYTINVTDFNGDGLAQLNATVTSEFPAVFFILNSDCVVLEAFAQGETNGCTATTISACVTAPGTYRIFVGPGTADAAAFSGNPCGSGSNDYILTVTCDDICTPPPNDSCINAEPIGNGAFFFNSVNATTDGPAHILCDPSNSGDTQIHNDVWFLYTATCTGDLIIDACNSVSFDTRIAIYDACVCPVSEADLLVCNDDLSGCEAGSSSLFAPVVAGQCYLIRVGGFNGAEGIGTITLSCWPGGLCPDTGDCGIANGSPSCSDSSCCETVCAVDQYCCLVEWDDLCAQQAAALCSGESTEACCLSDGTCQLLTPTNCLAAGGVAQGAGTTCASVTCSTPPAKEACCLLEGVCIDVIPGDCIGFGGSPQGAGTTCGGQLTCLPEACCLADDSCQNLTRDECLAAGGTPNGPATDCATFSCLPATQACCLTEVVCINADPVDCVGFNGTPLGPGTVCASSICLTPCDADIAPLDSLDGQVNVSDLLSLLTNWGLCPAPCPSDVNDDGRISVADLLILLSSWGPCP